MFKRKPDVAPGVIPFSVADMEIMTPPEIVAGLKDYLDREVLGYDALTAPYLDAVVAWMARRHGWRVEGEWLVETNGVVPSLFAAVNAFTDPGDGVIIMTPVYRPFYLAVTGNRRTIVDIPLLIGRDGYGMDFDRLEEEAKKERNKILLFCSPHNPVGRVWRREELERVAAICLENRVFVVSDEIHFDLTMPGYSHTVFASLGEEAAMNCLVATSPSKTFNIAGLQGANIFIPDPRMRKLFVGERRSRGVLSINNVAYQACRLAYARAEAWLDQLLEHIHGNYLLLREFMGRHFPEVRVHEMEGTYLAWLDFRAWGMAPEKLERFMVERAELFFSEGPQFGAGGEGFERMNLACPRHKLAEALERLRAARAL